MRKVVCFMVIAALCFLSGCGYRLSREAQSATSLTAGKTIAIPMWRNKSYRMNLEAVMTGCMIDEFALRTGGMVVSEEAAELILNGTIENYGQIAVSYTATDLVREYRITMTVNATLSDKRSQKVLWKGTLTGSQDYPAIIDTTVQNRTALQQDSEDAALQEISRKIAQQLYQKMSENF